MPPILPDYKFVSEESYIKIQVGLSRVFFQVVKFVSQVYSFKFSSLSLKSLLSIFRFVSQESFFKFSSLSRKSVLSVCQVLSQKSSDKLCISSIRDVSYLVNTYCSLYISTVKCNINFYLVGFVIY